MSSLFVIPARGGSKGIPGKNLKPLGGKPLILYTIEAATAIAKAEDVICVSTDDQEIVDVVEKHGIKVPFTRPAELATDHAGMREVLLHAINHYRKIGTSVSRVVLLQPTSPFRQPSHIKEAIKLYSSSLDMVVSVKEAKSNPYYTLFEENKLGFLEKCKIGQYQRRQDCPTVYEYNGAVYVINSESLAEKNIFEFSKIKKYLMDEISSVDLDTPLDWEFSEFLMQRDRGIV